MEHDIILDKKSGLYIREGTYDKIIIREVKSSYTWMDVKDKVVFDVGGCFGAYSNYALNAGAKQVICFEPDVGNAEMIRKNCGHFENFTLFNAAAVDTHEDEIYFYKSTSGKNCGNHSTTEFRGREKITVKAINFSEQLFKYQPEVIKMDCEGAEYDILTEELPYFVKQVSMEIHFSKPFWRKELGPKLIELFNHWETVKEPKITDNNWHTLGGWRR